MKRSSTLDRLERLELLKSRLKSEEALTIANIADEFGVSARTISRDIEILKEQGVPIETDRGRGGGIRLHVNWGVGRINFNYSEAVDLMITLAIAEQMKSPLFMANLERIRLKLDSSFSPTMKTKAKTLKNRILIAPSASIEVLSSFSSPEKNVTEQLHQAFLMQQRITIRYKAKNGKSTKRLIEPHFLFLSYPIWYVLAWDELRQDIRTFRCDRILKVEQEGSEFKLLPSDRFKKAMEGVDTV